MTKTEMAALATMTPDELIEAFVRESKLVQIADVNRANQAVDDAEALAGEIRRRDGLPSLATLLDSADPFIAYSAARLLARLPDFRERGLETLDRIVALRVGFASSRADTARNMIRYGNPDGNPAEVEKALAAIRARADHG